MFNKIQFSSRYAKSGVSATVLTVVKDDDKTQLFYFILTGSDHPVGAASSERTRSDAFSEKLVLWLKSQGLTMSSMNTYSVDNTELEKINRTFFIKETDVDFKELEVIREFAQSYHFIGRQVQNSSVYAVNKDTKVVFQLLPKLTATTEDTASEVLLSLSEGKTAPKSSSSPDPAFTTDTKVVSSERSVHNAVPISNDKIKDVVRKGGPTGIMAMVALAAVAVNEKKNSPNASGDQQMTVLNQESPDESRRYVKLKNGGNQGGSNVIDLG